jgi:hypothetical protein
LEHHALLDISVEHHFNQDLKFIQEFLHGARREWKEHRLKAAKIREEFLTDLAHDYTTLHHTSAEKALKAIKNSEKNRYDYQRSCSIVGHKKDKTPLTQITTLDQDFQDLILLTNRDDLEDAILRRNQQHTRSALVTPFASDDALKAFIDPFIPDNKILSGTFIEADPTISLSAVKKEWVQELKIKLTNTIEINDTTDDFISFFKRRKERTASSISGRHLGPYKTLAIAG